MHAAEPFPHFVDDYLNYLYEAHPTSATMDGVHLHDDVLEDFRKPAVESHLSALAGFARRLDAIPADMLPETERVEHAIVTSNIRARVFEFEQMRSWERNPYYYAETLASSLAAQAIFDYAPEADRARRVLSKLRQTPRLIEAARENIKEPPAIFVKVGLETLRAS
jgi:ATP phosphoribosyltransferase regulatory subunit HisZ